MDTHSERNMQILIFGHSFVLMPYLSMGCDSLFSVCVLWSCEMIKAPACPSVCLWTPELWFANIKNVWKISLWTQKRSVCFKLSQRWTTQFMRSFCPHKALPATRFRKISIPLLRKHSILTYSPGLMSITQYCRDYHPPNPPSLLIRHRFTWRNKPLPPPDVAFSLTKRWGFKICRCQPPSERFISIFETKFH